MTLHLVREVDRGCRRRRIGLLGDNASARLGSIEDERVASASRRFSPSIIRVMNLSATSRLERFQKTK
jgi:hypothetical protein